MDWTLVTIAGVGIVGTLTAPLVTGRVQRKATKENRVYEERIAVYAELLEVVGHLADNALTLAAAPLVEDLPEPSDDRLRALFARVRVVASDEVYKAAKESADLSTEFYRELVMNVAPTHRRVRREDDAVDTEETIKGRMDLGTGADALQKSVVKLEGSVRKEMTP